MRNIKIFSYLIFLLFAVTLMSCSDDAEVFESNATVTNDNITDFQMRKDVDIDLTLEISADCSVHIEGTISVNIWKLEIEGYDLTVTFSGDGCQGTHTVVGKISKNTVVLARGNSKLTDEYEVYDTELSTSDNEYQDVLNSEEFLIIFEQAMTNYIQTNY